MQNDRVPPYSPCIGHRFQSLIWSCLDADLTKSALFHAERYFVIDRSNHEARHLYATALLRDGETYSALNLVNGPRDQLCTGCLEIKARCCTLLGRHRQARTAAEETLKDTSYMSSASSSSRISYPFPPEASLRCKSGTAAQKGNLPAEAARSFRESLALNPFLWESFEGLCAMGNIPEVDTIFPPRLRPTKRNPPEEILSKPIASGAGFFTPDAAMGNGGNLFRPPYHGQLQAFRMGPPGPRDSIATNDSSFYPDNSFQVHRTTRSQPIIANPVQQVSRPLSSADEAGPATKRLRATSSSQPEAVKTKPSKATLDDQSKKARARPALSFANTFSSTKGRSQTTTSSRTTAAAGKTNAPPPAHTLTRRSTRLQTGAAPKPHATKQHTLRRRPGPSLLKNKSESDKDDEAIGEVAYSPSPPSAALSPRSERSPSPTTWTSAQEQQAQEEYEMELAEYDIYELVRQFARACRAISLFDCKTCINELKAMPRAQQMSRWVLAMMARCHYESQDYEAADRAFRTLRLEDPYRLWDMELYSSLLWQLQKSVELSFLAQELLNINSQSTQAWIAIGNLFSLQKERPQALTCFRRAFQLDPNCAYAYTLSGHESIDEDLDRAINFFQSALRSDGRHYNAWYGLGTCYMRMSKVRKAEYHFRKALDICPQNAVLLGCLALAVHRRGDHEGALEMFNKAITLDSTNALVRFRRAKIHIAMRKYQLAIEDLEYLKDATPDESNVIFQLARVYRLVGDVMRAGQLLAAARDISPKSMGKIKKLLETVRDEGERMEEG